MRRSALLTVAGLGVLVTLLGGTVLFSALQDTARSGTNSVESAAMATSADIELATATSSGTGISCGTFSENLASGLFAVTGLAPGAGSLQRYFCIRNIGSQQVTLSALADELTDVDFACTGDEEANGDASCGGDQLGELSSVLEVAYTTRVCATGASTAGGTLALKDHETTPHPLGALAASATGCFSVVLSYSNETPATAAQKAQSDRATWRFKFTAQA